MRTFSKSAKLENVLYDVRGPVVDEAARMEDEGERILKLNIGNPAPFGFRTCAFHYQQNTGIKTDRRNLYLGIPRNPSAGTVIYHVLGYL